MKYIKRFNEDKNVKDVCKKYKIKNWSVVDGKVDVDGDVKLSYKKLTSLDIFDGIPFGVVTGDFICYNNQLTSLEYGPTEVGGDYSCFNNKLRTLKYAPTKVSGNFYCQANKLTSLEYGPTKLGGDFTCDSNKLTSLEYAPTHVNGNFYCDNNQLTSLKYAPTYVEENFSCSNNQLTSLKYAPKTVGENFYCENNNILDFKYFPKVDNKLSLNTQLKYLYDRIIKSKDNIELFNDFYIIRGNRLSLIKLNRFIEYYGDGKIDTNELEKLGYKLS